MLLDYKVASVMKRSPQRKMSNLWRTQTNLRLPQKVARRSIWFAYGHTEPDAVHIVHCNGMVAHGIWIDTIHSCSVP